MAIAKRSMEFLVPIILESSFDFSGTYLQNDAKQIAVVGDFRRLKIFFELLFNVSFPRRCVRARAIVRKWKPWVPVFLKREKLQDYESKL